MNKRVKKIIDGLITDEMDSYAKLMACYDYLYDNMEYSYEWYDEEPKLGETSVFDIQLPYGEMEGLAAEMLARKKGQCHNYAALFTVMAQYLGFDAYMAYGGTRRSGGGYAEHKWVEIDFGGTTLLFDPQLEKSSASWSGSRYYYFGITYASDPERYIFDYRLGESHTFFAWMPME